MARAVDVSVVPIRRLVLNVARRDRHSLGSIADGTALCDISVSLDCCKTLGRLHSKNRSCCCCLTVVDVTDGSHVNVRLRSLKRTLCHYPNSRSNCARTPNEARQINHKKEPTQRLTARHQHTQQNNSSTQAEKLLKGLEPLTPSLPRTYSTN